MTSFKKSLVQASRFDRYAPEYQGTQQDLAELESPVVTVKTSVTIENNSVFLLVTNKETELVVLDFEIPLDIIKQNPAFGDQTYWTIKDSFLQKWTAPGSEVERKVLTKDDVINVSAATLITKDSTIFKEEYNNFYSPVRIFVPSKNSTINDLVIVLLDDVIPEGSVHPTTAETDPPDLETLQTWKDLLATITITGPATINVDEIVDLNIQCSDSSVSEVFVEPVIGATNKTRVLLDNGQGTLKVNTFGLSSGDEVNIKFGYKYFTGISRYTKTVS